MFKHTQHQPNTSFRILRLPGVRSESGYSRSTIYLRIAQGLWPKPIRLGPRAVGWPALEVAAMNRARVANRSDAELKSLVCELEAARVTADTTRRRS